MEEKRKQRGASADKGGAVGYAEVFKSKSSVRGVAHPPRNRKALENELYSVTSQELPAGSGKSFRSRQLSLGQYFSLARSILLAAMAAWHLLTKFH